MKRHPYEGAFSFIIRMNIVIYLDIYLIGYYKRSVFIYIKAIN